MRHAISLTHWGRVTHICVSKLTIIASDNGLSPGWRQAIIWTSAGISLIRTIGTNFSEILIELITFLLKKMRLKVSSAKWRPCCLGLNMLTHWLLVTVVAILYKSVISKHMLRNKFMSASCEIALRWMPQNTFDDNSTLVEVTAGYCQETSHYLSQCWTRFVLSYGITRPQWVTKKIFTFLILKFLWSLFPGVHISQHWFSVPSSKTHFSR